MKRVLSVVKYRTFTGEDRWGEGGTPTDKNYSAYITSDPKQAASNLKMLYGFDTALLGHDTKSLWMFELRAFFGSLKEINSYKIVYNSIVYNVIYQYYDNYLRRLHVYCYPDEGTLGING